MGLHLALGQVDQAKAVQRGIEHRAGAVEHKLSVDPDVEIAPVPFELPGVETVMRRQAQIDAVMAGEILRRAGLLARGEIGRRANDRHP